MKQFLRGLLYDTEKAEVVVSSKTQLADRWVILYKAAGGHYFVAHYSTRSTDREYLTYIPDDKVFGFAASVVLATEPERMTEILKQHFPDQQIQEA